MFPADEEEEETLPESTPEEEVEQELFLNPRVGDDEQEEEDEQTCPVTPPTKAILCIESVSAAVEQVVEMLASSSCFK